MLGDLVRNAPVINATIAGLGSLTANQRPVLRFLLKNWPVSALAGVALAYQLRKRYKKKDLSAFTAFADVGAVAIPLVGLFSLIKMAEETAEKERAAQAMAVYGSRPDARPAEPMAVPRPGALPVPAAEPLIVQRLM